MTIEYKDSKRIVGLSTDIVQTLTFEDDFDYATQALADASWVSLDTAVNRVNITNDNLDVVLKTNNSDDTMAHDLGSSLSDSSWVCRFKWNITGLTRNNTSAWHGWIGLSSTNQTGEFDDSQDSMGLGILTQNTGGNTMFWYASGSSAGAVNEQSSQFDDDVPTGTYYIEMIRNADIIRVNVYTDSNYSNLLDGGSNTISGTVTGLQYFKVANKTGNYSGTITSTIDDLKIYNGVTSVESVSPKVKQHFIEWFSGKQLPSYWTFTDIYETNSGAMVDEVGGGYKITTDTGGGNPTCSISFNKSSSSGNSNSNVCQYNYKGSVFNTVMKVDSTTSIEAKVGLKKNTSGNFNHSNATIYGSSTLTNWACFSGDESGRTAVESNIPLDTNWNNHKLTLQTTNILYDINGVLKVTKTDRLPTVENLQPQAQMVSLNTDAKSLSIRYMEVYNT